MVVASLVTEINYLTTEFPNIIVGSPHIDPNGLLWIITVASGNDQDPTAYKSTDGGQNWSLVATDADASTDAYAIASYISGSEIHVATLNPTALEYGVFDTSTETWTTSLTTVVSTSGVDFSIVDCDILVRNDGVIIIYYGGVAETVHGTDYGRRYMAYNNGSWTAGVAIDNYSGLQDGAAGRGMGLDNDGRVHFGFNQDAGGTDILMRTASAADPPVLNSAPDVIDTSVNTEAYDSAWPARGFPFNDGSEKMLFIYTDDPTNTTSGNDLESVVVTVADDPSTYTVSNNILGESADYNLGTGTPGSLMFSMCKDQLGNFHILYIDTSGNLKHIWSTDNGSNWNLLRTLETGLTANAISCSVIGSQIGYVYEDVTTTTEAIYFGTSDIPYLDTVKLSEDVTVFINGKIQVPVKFNLTNPYTGGTALGENAAIYKVGPHFADDENIYMVGCDVNGTDIHDKIIVARLPGDFSAKPSNIGSLTITNSGGAQLDDIGGLWSEVNGNTLSILTAVGTKDAIYYYYHEFNISTDSWDVSNELVDGPTNAYSIRSCMFTKRDNGEIVALINASNDTNTDQVWYTRRTGAATWTTPVVVGAGAASDEYAAACVKGENDRIIFSWNRTGTGAYFRILSQSNTLSSTSSTSVNSAQIQMGTAGAKYLPDRKEVIIPFIQVDSTTGGTTTSSAFFQLPGDSDTVDYKYHFAFLGNDVKIRDNGTYSVFKQQYEVSPAIYPVGGGIMSFLYKESSDDSVVLLKMYNPDAYNTDPLVGQAAVYALAELVAFNDYVHIGAEYYTVANKKILLAVIGVPTSGEQYEFSSYAPYDATGDPPFADYILLSDVISVTQETETLDQSIQDVINLSEDDTKTISKLLDDKILLSDILQTQLGFAININDILIVSDIGQLQADYKIENGYGEQIKLSELRSIGLFTFLSESVSEQIFLSDNDILFGISKSIFNGILLSDSVTVSSSGGIQRIIEDVILLTDTIMLEKATQKTEKIILYDEIAKTIDKTLYDAVLLFDDTELAYSKTLTDGALLSDAIAKALLKSIKDIITLSEDISRDMTKAIDDSVVLSDVFENVKARQNVYSDAILLREEIEKIFSKTALEKLLLSDDTAFGSLKYIYDGIILNETILKALTKTIIDNILLSDSVTVNQFGSGVQIYTEQINISDILEKVFSKILNDKIVLSEVIKVISVANRSNNDKILLSEIILRTLTSNIVYLDKVLLSDIIQKTISKTVFENIILAEEIEVSKSKLTEEQDGITISENIYKSAVFSRDKIDNVLVSDSVNLEIATLVDKTINIGDLETIVYEKNLGWFQILLSEKITVVKAIIGDHSDIQEILTISDDAKKQIAKSQFEVINLSESISLIVDEYSETEIDKIVLSEVSNVWKTFVGKMGCAGSLVDTLSTQGIIVDEDSLSGSIVDDCYRGSISEIGYLRGSISDITGISGSIDDLC